MGLVVIGRAGYCKHMEMFVPRNRCSSELPEGSWRAVGGVSRWAVSVDTIQFDSSAFLVW